MMDKSARGRHVASDRLLRVAGGQFAALAGKEWKSWFENFSDVDLGWIAFGDGCFDGGGTWSLLIRSPRWSGRAGESLWRLQRLFEWISRRKLQQP